ncbi:hypothetical protein [Xanthovirga aplysinae]|uniref:hypothetical protein n=1 Tax=Xanthovirga aplysinae TaxID=2529853 RepID=UPI0012BB8744|nr:hypothetical protein [Xanthovirga aplysinae]MTI29544.1 hypothetical protein [Xanthovirga aplysinae]
MKVIEVRDKWSAKEFLMLPVRLYKDEKSWIRPLDQDIEGVFDPKVNKYFRHGECIRWILLNDEGQTIGRVAAFIDKKTVHKYDEPTGGMGFFECIQDKEAAFKLLGTAKEWLVSKEMEAMIGPVNFGDRDRWWGLLVDGWTEPTYGMPYNFPYYQEYFEAYGFKDYFQQYTYRRPIAGGLEEKVRDRAQRVFNNPGYHFEHSRKNNLEKYGKDFRTIYNEAWGNHSGVAKMSEAQARASMEKIKPIMDERLLWFGYFNGEPIAFFIMLPEMNQIFKHVNGKLNLIGKAKFLYHKVMRTNKKIFGLVFGVVPKHQGKGVETAIVERVRQLSENPRLFPYEDIQLNWIPDNNPKMMKVAAMMGGKIHKTHITYRMIFDETKEFKRAPIMR